MSKRKTQQMDVDLTHDVREDRATKGGRLKKLNAQEKSSSLSKSPIKHTSRKSSNDSISKGHGMHHQQNARKISQIDEEPNYDPSEYVDSDEELMANLHKKLAQKNVKKSPEKPKSNVQQSVKKGASATSKIQAKKEPIEAKTKDKGIVTEAKSFQIPPHADRNRPLSGLTIVLTGEFEYSNNRDDIKTAIESLGAKVTGSVSGKTSLLIHGHQLEGGRAFTEGNKYKEAKKKGTPTLSESEFIQLIKTKFGFHPFEILGYGDNDNQIDEEEIKPKMNGSHQLWVDLFAPQKLNEIIGNISNVKKLKEWIESWSAHPQEKNAKRTLFKAALLSGPPGIGKTTTAKLCAESCGKEVIIQNASDARNKTAVNSFLGVLGNNMVLNKKDETDARECVIIMDEVDGMSGDRGGITALIQQIKASKVPIICICNDRQSAKIKSLANYCLDIKFVPPSVQELKKKLEYIMSRVEVNGPVPSEHDLEVIAQTSNGDIRHAISNLQFWTAYSHSLETTPQEEQTHGNIKLNKDNILSLNVNTACNLLFKIPAENIHDLKNLFFVDYNLMPFYVFENYINFAARKYKHIETEVLEDLYKLDSALDSFMAGDYISQNIRENRDYQLLSSMSFYSAVQPAVIARPNAGFVTFPQMLGKISSFNKRRRLLRELRNHYASAITFLSDDGVLQSSKVLLTKISSLMDKNKFDELYDIYSHFDLNPQVVKENICELMYTEDKSTSYDSVSVKSKTAFSKHFLAKAGDDGVFQQKGGNSKKPTKGKANAEKASVAESKDDENEDEEGEFDEHFEGEFDFIDD